MALINSDISTTGRRTSATPASKRTAPHSLVFGRTGTRTVLLHQRPWRIGMKLRRMTAPGTVLVLFRDDKQLRHSRTERMRMITTAERHSTSQLRLLARLTADTKQVRIESRHPVLRLSREQQLVVAPMQLPARVQQNNTGRWRFWRWCRKHVGRVPTRPRL